MKESGSPNGSIHRTFRASFKMPFHELKHSLVKIRKQQYRNPIYLAREWRAALNSGDYASSAALARNFKVTRARVTQILNLLQLSPEAIALLSSLGDPFSSRIVSERRLRGILGMDTEKQTEHIKLMLLMGKCSPS